jgi:hypothetical protein
MYIRLKIEWGEMVVPSLQKARQMAELLQMDVVTEIYGEDMRINHTGNFDAESEFEKHKNYCDRVQERRAECLKKPVLWRPLGFDEVTQDGDCYFWFEMSNLNPVDSELGRKAGLIIHNWSTNAPPHAIVRRVEDNDTTQTKDRSTIITIW